MHVIPIFLNLFGWCNNTRVICRLCLELPLNVLQTTEYHNKQISNKSVALGFLDVVCQISL